MTKGSQPLFGDKEGRIALANRHKDPLLLFAALERHLNYPTVPRPQPVDESRQIIPTLMRPPRPVGGRGSSSWRRSKKKG